MISSSYFCLCQLHLIFQSTFNKTKVAEHRYASYIVLEGMRSKSETGRLPLAPVGRDAAVHVGGVSRYGQGPLTSAVAGKKRYSDEDLDGNSRNYVVIGNNFVSSFVWSARWHNWNTVHGAHVPLCTAEGLDQAVWI
jgi:hypothetical protein